MHAHARAHSHRLAHTHTCTNTCTRSHAHMHRHGHGHARTDARTHACIHAPPPLHTPARIGAGDRLGLCDELTGESLPAGMLQYCGRTMIHGLLRDLQAREYLYYSITGQQVRGAPVACPPPPAPPPHHTR